MKIDSIKVQPNHIYNKSCANRQYSVPISIGNIQNLPFCTINNRISFKSNKQATLFALQSYGYEFLEKDLNNKIINKGGNIIIRGLEDLLSLAKSPQAWHKNFAMLADIDLKGIDFQGIGSRTQPFNGIFDGNGYTIKNLNIKSPDSTVGFFQYCDNAQVKNLTLQNIDITGNSEVGGLIGTADNNTQVTSVQVDGVVAGNNTVGGIVGYSNKSMINNAIFSGTIKAISSDEIFLINNFWDDDFDNISEETGYNMGGIVGLGSFAILDNIAVFGDIYGKNYISAVVGHANRSYLKNIHIAANVHSASCAGSVIGNGKNCILESICSLNKKIVGVDNGYEIKGKIEKVADINKNGHLNWDNKVWYLSSHQLPRMKQITDRIEPINIFLEDLNYDIQNKNINITNLQYTPSEYISVPLKNLEPPKHYIEHEKILQKIKNCNSHDKLSDIFANYTDLCNGFYPEDKKHDEILLALIQNPAFNLNEHCKSGWANYCTPLYVLSSLNKGYIFNEALKRNDIDPFIQNGPCKNVDIFRALCKYPISTNMYLLCTSKNPKVQKYVLERKKEYINDTTKDYLTNLLLENDLKNFKLDIEKNVASVKRELIAELNSLQKINIQGRSSYSTIWDVVESPDIPTNYQDSMNNTFLHISLLKNQSVEEQLCCLKNFIENSGNLSLKNRDGLTPYDIALKNANGVILSEFLKNDAYKYNIKDSEGNNAFMITIKFDKTGESTLSIINMHKLGCSINCKDNFKITPLMQAIMNNDIQKINYFISRGAAIDACDENGQTALHHAFLEQNVYAIKTLMNAGAALSILDSQGFAPEDYWEERNENEEFQALNWDFAKKQQEYADFKNLDYQIFQNEDKNLEELYFEFSQNPQKFDTYYLMEDLVKSNNPNSKELIIKILEGEDFNINRQNTDGETYLITALKAYQEAKDDKEKFACIQIIKILLDHDAKIDMADLNKQTALHHAVFTDNFIIFNELLGKHPNINATDELGLNPIQYIPENSDNNMRITYNTYAQERSLNK